MDGYSLGYDAQPLPDNGKSVDVVPPSPAAAGQDFLTTIGEAQGASSDAEAELDRRLGDVMATSYQASRYDASTIGNDVALSDAIDTRNQAVFQATGEQLENPMKGGYFAPASAALQASRPTPAPFTGPTAAMMAGADSDSAGDLQAKQLDLYNAALAAVAKKHPDKPNLAAPILKARNDLITQAEQAQGAAAARVPGAAALPASLLGGFGASLRDPLQMLALGVPGGGELRAGTALGRMVAYGLRAGAINAGVQAAQEPKLQQNRAERGVDHGLGPALADIAQAAAFGAPFGLVHGLLAKHGATTHGPAALAGEPAAVESVASALPRETAPVLHAAALDHALDRAVMEHRPSRADPQALGQAVRDAVRFGEGIGPLPQLVPDAGGRIEPTLDFRTAVEASSVPPAAAAEIPAMVANPTDHLAMLDALEAASAATPEEARAVLTDELRVQSHPQAVEALLSGFRDPEVDVGTQLGERVYRQGGGSANGYYHRVIEPGPELAPGTPAGDMSAAMHFIQHLRPDFVGGEAEAWITPYGVVRIAHDAADVGYRQSSWMLQPIAVDRRNGIELLPRVLDTGTLSEFPEDSIQRMIAGLADDGLAVIDHDHRNFGYHNGRLVTFDPGAVAPIRSYGNPAALIDFAKTYGVDLKAAVERARRDGVGPDELAAHPREAARFDPTHPLHVERKAITDAIAADLTREGFEGVGYDARDVMDNILDKHLRGRRIANDANAMLEESPDDLTRAALDRGIAALDHLGDEPADEPAIDVASARPSRPSGPQTLLGFLRAAGGLKDDGGELAARDLQKVFPGLVNNRAGVPLDRAREMAAEAGYLGPDAERAVTETTVDDLLHAIDNHPVYSVHDEGRLADRAEASERRQWLRETKAARSEIVGHLAEAGTSTDPELIHAAAERMVALGEGIEDALERAADDALREQPNHEEPFDLSGTGDPSDDGGGERAAGERAPADAAAAREPTPDAGDAGDGRGEPRFEPGAEGRPQQLIDGVAPVTDRDRLALEAARPLRGGNAPMTGGLFGGGLHPDLFDLTPLAERDDGGNTAFAHPADLAAGETPEEQLARHIRECPF